MKSRWLINLLLLTGIGLLALVVWLEPGIEAPPPAEKVTSLEPEQVQRIELHRSRHAGLVLEQDASGHWYLQHDPPLPADSFHINSLIKLADQEAWRSYPVADMDLTRLDLDPPASSITLNQTRIDFGRQEALEALRYVLSGDRVLLIPDLYQYLVDADFSQFVRRRLFATDRHITAIRLPGLSLQKNDADWSVMPAQEISADDIQQFIQRWESVAALLVQKAGEAAGQSVEIELDNPPALIRFSMQVQDSELVLGPEGSGIQYRLANEGNALLQIVAADGGEDE